MKLLYSILLLGIIMVTTFCVNQNVEVTSYSQESPMVSPKELTDNNISVGLEGLYFGISENQDGRRAWLLRFENNQGTLYMPPNNLPIKQVKISSAKDVSFQSNSGLGSVIYSFEGHLVSDGIQGEFNLLTTNKTSNNSVKVLLKKLDESLPNKLPINGIYTSVQYVEESGDLVGDELILIPYENSLVGIFTSYENEMDPYVANVEYLKNKISFNINTGNTEQKFRGTISPKRVVLSRIGKNVDPNIKPSILVMKQSLKDILKN